MSFGAPFLRLTWPIGVLFCVAAIACKETRDIAEPPLYESAPFPVGTAVSITRVWEDPTYEAVVRHHFNRVTPESAMKMAAIHPERDTYNWVYADGLIDFAEASGKTVHGHVLVWHEALPSWVNEFQGDEAAWTALLEEHVTTVVSRYAGRVAQWDVVNEAFEDDGSLRATVWAEHIGPDYLELAFQWAAEADPNAALFYNDFGLVSHPDKLAAVLDMVDAFRAHDPPIRIDGVGLQLHVDLTRPDVAALESTVDTLTAHGLMVHFSELDVALNPDGSLEEVTDALLEAQRDRYQEIVAAQATLAENVSAGVTVWGVSDADSWIRLEKGRLDWPLLFDEAFQPKPAFFGFKDGLEAAGPPATPAPATLTQTAHP